MVHTNIVVVTVNDYCRMIAVASEEEKEMCVDVFLVRKFFGLTCHAARKKTDRLSLI